jgi:hypothetical protein
MLEVRRGEVNSATKALSHAISVLGRIDEDRIKKIIETMGSTMTEEGNFISSDCREVCVKELAKAIVEEIANGK